MTRNENTEDTTESETDEPSRRLDDTKEDVSSVANERSDSDNRGALRRPPRAFPEPSSLRTSAPPPPESTSIPARVVVDALDAVDLDAEGAAERDTAGHFVRADVSADEAFLSADESDDESDPGASDDASDEARDDANDLTTSRGRRGAARRRVRRRVAPRQHDRRQENRARRERRGLGAARHPRRRGGGWAAGGDVVRDSAGPGEGMRVGDVYLGVVAKVIGGMQGVLVDVTGKGPPYSLMQKGVDEPALAWREADAGYERELELERMEKADSEKPDAARAENEGDEGRGSARLDGTSPGAPSVLPNQSPEPEGTLASEARLARLERKAAASAIGSRAGGRWADARAEGVGVSDSFDGERAAGSSSAETVAASLETFAEERPDAAAGVATVAPVATFDAAGETRAPPPFAWAPWRRGGGAARTAEAAARTDEPLREEDAASSTRAAASSGAPDSSAPHSACLTTRFAPLTAAERRGGRGVVEDWVPGMPVVVQVTRLGSGHKGPRVTRAPHPSRAQRRALPRRRRRVRAASSPARLARTSSPWAPRWLPPTAR